MLRDIRSTGFALPAIILTGAALIVASLVISQGSVALKQSLDSQFYNSLATDAAKAGLKYAESCRLSGALTWSELRPDTSCISTTSTGNAYLFNANQTRSRYSVTTPTVNSTSTVITSSGIVEVLSSTGTVVRTYTQKTSTNINSTVGSLTTPTVVSSGDAHSCSAANGKAYCWGTNFNGELGDGTYSSKNTKTAVDTSGVLAGKIVTDLSVGASHTCAVASGAAYCWGLGSSGQLGNGSTNSSSQPVAVTVSGVLSGKTVTDITAGGTHSCAIADGAAYCWGSATNGRLGNGTTSPQSSVPVTVTVAMGILMGRTVTKISSGNAHTCVVANGAAFCWGQGTSGQLGNAGATASSTPVTVVTASGVMSGRSVTDIATGTNHSCAVANGAAFCWGAGGSGRLGNSATSQQNSPVAVTTTGVLSGRTVTDITAGGLHTCAVANGAAFCWGSNLSSQLGNGLTTQSSSPVTVTSSGALNSKAVTSIHGGGTNTCAIAAGSGFCWGDNSSGQLGDGTTTGRSTAVEVTNMNGNNRSHVAAGASHSCAVANGAAYCWGLNTNGQLGDGTNTQSTSAVAVNASGLLSGKTVTKVAAGASHSCAVANGAAFCWGDNTNGQLGNRSTTASSVPVAVTSNASLSGKTVTDIYAGGNHTCAIANGMAHCWGLSLNGQVGYSSRSTTTEPQTIGTTVALNGRTVTAMDLAAAGTCAVANGAGFCWGIGTNYRIGNGGNFEVITPTAVDTSGALSGKTISDISTGNDGSCVVANSQPFCWGAAGPIGSFGFTYSSAGDNTATLRTLPTAAFYEAGALQGTVTTDIETSIVPGACSISGINILCWGANSPAHINSAAAEGYTKPTRPYNYTFADPFTQINKYGLHLCGISNGNTVCFGQNSNGQLGRGNTSSMASPGASIDGAMPANPTPPAGSSSTIQF